MDSCLVVGSSGLSSLSLPVSCDLPLATIVSCDLPLAIILLISSSGSSNALELMPVPPSVVLPTAFPSWPPPKGGVRGLSCNSESLT